MALPRDAALRRLAADMGEEDVAAAAARVADYEAFAAKRAGAEGGTALTLYDRTSDLDTVVGDGAAAGFGVWWRAAVFASWFHVVDGLQCRVPRELAVRSALVHGSIITDALVPAVRALQALTLPSLAPHAVRPEFALPFLTALSLVKQHLSSAGAALLTPGVFVVAVWKAHRAQPRAWRGVDDWAAWLLHTELRSVRDTVFATAPPCRLLPDLWSTLLRVSYGVFASKGRADEWRVTLAHAEDLLPQAAQYMGAGLGVGTSEARAGDVIATWTLPPAPYHLYSNAAYGVLRAPSTAAASYAWLVVASALAADVALPSLVDAATWDDVAVPVPVSVPAPEPAPGRRCTFLPCVVEACDGRRPPGLVALADAMVYAALDNGATRVLLHASAEAPHAGMAFVRTAGGGGAPTTPAARVLRQLQGLDTVLAALNDAAARPSGDADAVLRALCCGAVFLHPAVNDAWELKQCEPVTELRRAVHRYLTANTLCETASSSGVWSVAASAALWWWVLSKCRDGSSMRACVCCAAELAARHPRCAQLLGWAAFVRVWRRSLVCTPAVMAACSRVAVPGGLATPVGNDGKPGVHLCSWKLTGVDCTTGVTLTPVPEEDVPALLSEATDLLRATELHAALDRGAVSPADVAKYDPEDVHFAALCHLAMRGDWTRDAAVEAFHGLLTPGAPCVVEVDAACHLPATAAGVVVPFGHAGDDDTSAVFRDSCTTVMDGLANHDATHLLPSAYHCHPLVFTRTVIENAALRVRVSK